MFCKSKTVAKFLIFITFIFFAGFISQETERYAFCSYYGYWTNFSPFLSFYTRAWILIFWKHLFSSWIRNAKKHGALLRVLKAMTENQPRIADPYLIAFDVVTQDKLRTVFASFKYLQLCFFSFTNYGFIFCIRHVDNI